MINNQLLITNTQHNGTDNIKLFFLVGLTFIFHSYVLGLFTVEGGAMTHAVRRCRLFMESQDLFWDGE